MTKRAKSILLLALLALTTIALWLILAKPMLRPLVLPAPEEATEEDIQNAWQHWTAVHHNDPEEAARLLKWLDEVAYLRLQKEAPK